MSCYIPCTDCARAIIQVGITEVILGDDGSNDRQKWVDAAKRSKQMFEEAGVKVRHYNELS